MLVERASWVAGTDQLSMVFSALADPTRRAILELA
jgi:DNA-binding transcriptional ArsR family regulator